MELDYHINILINSTKLINIYVNELKKLYTHIEEKYHLKFCKSCKNLNYFYDNYDYLFEYSYFNGIECSCMPVYDQNELIFKRNIIDEDKIFYINKKLIEQLNIRDNTTKNIDFLVANNRDYHRHFDYCKECDNITQIYL